MLVHHGIFGKDFFNLRGFLKKRVEKVIKNDLTLMGYHLPLDTNLQLGNNISLISELGLIMTKRVGIAFIGEYEKPLKFEEFENKLKDLFGDQPLTIYKNNDFVHKVGVVSGGGSSLMETLEGEIDTFVTGEVKEQTRNMAKEMGITFINAGHYATETFGIKNLGELIKQQFNIDTVFIDVYNNI